MVIIVVDWANTAEIFYFAYIAIYYINLQHHANDIEVGERYQKICRCMLNHVW